MREFKFRAYLDDFEEMFYRVWLVESQLYVDLDGKPWDVVDLDDRVHVMQYTGLKDKSGKEIYEGDIHEYDGRHFPVKFGYYTDDDTHVEMYGWYLDSNSLEEQGSLGVDSEKYVNIIGNIHENPELLKVTSHDI